MGQEDYLLREIDKLGMVMRAILNSLAGGKENFAITLEKQFEETKEILLNEINFDIDKLLKLNDSEILEYISGFKGFTHGNLEILAEITAQFGFNGKPDEKRIRLEKALLLFEICEQYDKTFSIERENRITIIKDALAEINTI
jgi:hypothetical protein